MPEALEIPFGLGLMFGIPALIGGCLYLLGKARPWDAEWRATKRHQRRLRIAIARYVDMGLTPSDAKAMAESDAIRASQEIRAALQQTDGLTQSAPRLRSVR